MQRLPDRHPTCCMGLVHYAVSTSYQWGNFSTSVVYIEGETGRQQSMFSTTNDFSLDSSTTTTALAQTGLHGKQDRQACFCLLCGTDQKALLNWLWHLRGISSSCMQFRAAPDPLYQHCFVSSVWHLPGHCHAFASCTSLDATSHVRLHRAVQNPSTIEIYCTNHCRQPLTSSSN